MKISAKQLALVTAMGLAAGWAAYAANAPQMSFFVTSQGSGKGADLGGLAGADALCQRLATAAGAGNRTWAAYLSTQGAGAVNAKDRIGSGPWYNAKGQLIAQNVADLLKPEVKINADTALTEKGQPIGSVKVGADGAPLPREQQSGVQHDILTGTQADGTAFPAGEDRTCANWTSSGTGSAMLGHHDRRSLQPGLSPWAAAHPSQGCSQENLVATGGAGMLYCFAK
jgi:hypothetical protein